VPDAGIAPRLMERGAHAGERPAGGAVGALVTALSGSGRRQPVAAHRCQPSLSIGLPSSAAPYDGRHRSSPSEQHASTARHPRRAHPPSSSDNRPCPLILSLAAALARPFLSLFSPHRELPGYSA